MTVLPMEETNDRTLFDETPADAAPRQKSLTLDANLAQCYRRMARAVRLEGEEALAKRLAPKADDPRLKECREFLRALAAARSDGLPILFNVLMRESVVAIHSLKGRDRFPEILFGSRTAIAGDGKVKGLRHSLAKTFTTTPGKDGGFPGLPIVMGRLLVLNSMGYDVHVVANGMLFNHRCKRTCPWVRILVVELDGAPLLDQERLLEAIKPIVAAAVFSGKRSIHLFVPLSRPIRNRHAVRAGDWKGFRSLKAAGGLKGEFKVPEFEAAIEGLRGIVFEAAGHEPDPKVLGNFACLTRAPGFRHGETGGLSRLLYADPLARWNAIPLTFLPENGLLEEGGTHPEPTTQKRQPSGGAGRSGSAIIIQPASPTGDGDGIHQNGGTKGTKEGGVEGGIEASTGGGEGCGGSPANSTPSSTTPNTVLSIDDTKRDSDRPHRTFLDDLGEFEGLLSGGIPARHLRIKLHGVVVNAARILGWLPGAVADGDKVDEAPLAAWASARGRLMAAWHRVMERTPHGNTDLSVDEAVQDFGQHFDTLAKGRSIKPFKPRMPDFTTLPEFEDIRVASREVRRKIIALMENGILPLPDGSIGMRRHVASGAARIIVEMLCPLARRVPGQCLEGRASIQAARMRGMCPGRRHQPVVQWLADANILRVTRKDYAKGNPILGQRGRTRLYHVNLPLVVWLAGFGKGSLSWAAHKPSTCPHVASNGIGEGQDATRRDGSS